MMNRKKNRDDASCDASCVSCGDYRGVLDGKCNSNLEGGTLN
jgi:hypothetical protein